jgi:hypothetical protein
MKKNTHHPIRQIIVGAGLVACSAFLIARALPVHADLPAPHRFDILTSSEQVAAPLVPAAPLEPDLGAVAAEARRVELVEYTTAVMASWPKALIPAVSNLDVATSIVNVTASADDAILLAGIGYFEGARYAEYVDSGHCNDPVWRRSPEGVAMMHHGDCDHGQAHSTWQVHPIQDKSSPLYALCSVDAVDSSREGAARCALELAHQSLRATGTLANYTGEWTGPHPAADVRLSFVKKALAAHPFASHVVTP